MYLFIPFYFFLYLFDFMILKTNSLVCLQTLLGCFRREMFYVRYEVQFYIVHAVWPSALQCSGRLSKRQISDISRTSVMG